MLPQPLLDRLALAAAACDTTPAAMLEEMLDDLEDRDHADGAAARHALSDGAPTVPAHEMFASPPDGDTPG